VVKTWGQNEEYLWKEWVKIIETWHQHRNLRKKKQEGYFDVAMVSFSLFQL